MVRERHGFVGLANEHGPALGVGMQSDGRDAAPCSAFSSRTARIRRTAASPLLTTAIRLGNLTVEGSDTGSVYGPPAEDRNRRSEQARPRSIGCTASLVHLAHACYSEQRSLPQPRREISTDKSSTSDRNARRHPEAG